MASLEGAAACTPAVLSVRYGNTLTDNESGTLNRFLMKASDTSVMQNSAGIVWASAGIVLLTLTFVGVGCVQASDPLPPEGVFALLALGGVPATIAMLMGFLRGFVAKKEFLDSDSVYSSGIRRALFGLGLLSLGVALFAGDCWRRHVQKRRWMAEAQAAVEDVLHTADRIPEEMRERLGPFKSLDGQNFYRAGGVLGGPNLRANRDAHFANATIPVRIWVRRLGKTTQRGQEIVVESVERNQQLYLIYRGQPQGMTEGLEIWVLHPDYRRL